jgi:hypothetical protein
MAIGFTSLQLLTLSGLLQDRGLRLPTSLTNRVDSLKATDKLSGRLNYIAWHPQNNAAMTAIRAAIREHVAGIAGVVPSSYTQALPETLRTFDVVGSVKTRADNLLGNGLKGILDNLGVISGELQKSFDVQASLDTYKNAKFSDIYLNAKSYTDVISHGITSSFGSLAEATPASLRAKEQNRRVTVAEVRRELASFTTAVEKLGSLYDWSELGYVGTAAGLVRNFYKIGVAYNTQLNNLLIAQDINPDSILDNQETRLAQILKQIIGKDIAVIIKAAGATLPNPVLITTGADFLNAEKILPADVASMLPNKNLKSLGKKLISLGVNSDNIKSVLSSFNNVEIKDLPILANLVVPIPAFDANVIQNNLISGQGEFRNATLDDVMGVLTGQNYNAAMDAIIAANNYFSQNASTLMSETLSIYNTLLASGTVSSGQATAFVTAAQALRQSINSQTPEQAVRKIYDAGEQGVITIINSLRKEILNGEILNLAITSNIQVSSANTIVDTFDIRNIRKATYKINVQNNDKFEDFEAKVVHNGTTANLLVYNQLLVGSAQSLGNVYFAVNTSANTCSISYAAAADNNYHYFLRHTVDYIPIHDGNDPATLNGGTQEINTLYKLNEIATDAELTGLGNLLESMASTDLYGEAILATLATARNTDKLQGIGIREQRANPRERLAQSLAKRGANLSDLELRTIRQMANTQNINANTAISNASRYGMFTKK